jgi:isopenicillin N synthase-like dioxygenase
MSTERKVPELSLLSYVNGNEQDQIKFVNDLFNGIKDYGFIILTDHTITQDIIDKGYAATKEFLHFLKKKRKKL